MLTCVSDWISSIQGVVTIIALVAGTIIAWNGLTTWKDQLLLRVDYDVARRVLVAAYKARDAIMSARGNEIEKAIVQRGGEASQEVSTSLRERWDAFLKAMREYDVELLEAQALWDKDAVDVLAKLRLSASELRFAFEMMAFPWNEADLAEFSETLFRRVPKATEKDEFDRLLKEHVSEIEGVLRPKLALKRSARPRA
jgi:hypothetical protein